MSIFPLWASFHVMMGSGASYLSGRVRCQGKHLTFFSLVDGSVDITVVSWLVNIKFRVFKLHIFYSILLPGDGQGAKACV